MKDENNIELDRARAAWSLPGVMFVIAALVLLAGFLVPFPAKILDILWVCSFCLAGAVAIICIATRSSSDLMGFVPMLVGLSLLRMVVQAGTARRIIQDEPVGILLSAIGSLLASTWPLGTVLICLAMAVIIVTVVFTACQKTILASTGYRERILPLKRMGIETDLRLEVINENQADMLDRRITSESRFFAGMHGAAMLMRAEAAVCVFILLACLVIPAGGNRPSGSAFLSGIAPSVVGLSVVALVPAFIVSVVSGMLMSKDTLTLGTGNWNESASAHTQQIKIVSLETDAIQDSEPYNPDFSVSKGTDERIVEFEPIPGGFLPSPADISCRNAKEYYEKLSQFICTVNHRPRVVLLATDKVHSLPVTVAVNIAIRLAQKKQKVLLVDTDTERNAVSQVFDLDGLLMQKKVQSSCFENLSVCGVSADKLNKFLKKADILNRFGTTLLYTPNVRLVQPVREKGAVRPGVFFFVDDESTNAEQKAVEKLGFCSWLCLIPSLQSVLDLKRQIGA